MWETIQSVGSVVGLLTGIYTIFDRLLRFRPTLYILGQGPKGSIGFSVIAKNPGRSPILIRSVSTYPRLYGVSKNDKLDSIASAAIGDTFFLQLAADQEHSFPFIRLLVDGRQVDENRPGTFAIVLSWRRVESLWLPQFPKIIFCSTRHLNELRERL